MDTKGCNWLDMLVLLTITLTLAVVRAEWVKRGDRIYWESSQPPSEEQRQYLSILQGLTPRPTVQDLRGQGSDGGHKGHRHQSQGQSHKGTQCTYNFVVNELDSTKCPTLQSDNKKPPGFQNDQEILNRYYENLNMNKDFDNLVRRIDTLENKLLREVAKNRELERDILELENTVKHLEKTVNYNEQNVTNVAAVVKKGEIMQV